MSATKIDPADLAPEVKRAMGYRKPRESKFTANQMRTWALRCLGPLAGLTREQRDRVLRHALKINRL